MTVRVAVAGAGEVVDAGLRMLLSCDGVIEFVKGDPRTTRPDVVLYDVIGMHEDGVEELWGLIATGVPVIAIGRPLRPDLAARAVAHGAVVTLPTEATADDLRAAVLAAATGASMPVGIHEVSRLASGPREDQLTPREVDVLTGVARGLSNQAICQQLGIQLNTVKSVIRNAYRKIGVTTRPQAMAWCLQHGFEPPSEDPDDQIS